MSARKAALLTLIAVERQDAWANAQLKKEIGRAQLARRDAALATRLCFGTLQNRLLLDFYMAAFSTMKPEKMEPAVRNALRLALYQVLFLERIPHSAAVNETVSLTRRYAKNPRAAGMVNGILRSFLRNLDALPQPDGDKWTKLSLQYSHPRWLLEELSRQLPDQAELEALLQIHNQITPTCVQRNTLQGDAQRFCAQLEAEGVELTPHPWLPDCFLLEKSGNLEQLESFRQGMFYVQDAAAKLAVLAASPQPGEKVLDACAAPGGKSFGTAIAMGDQGQLIACDCYPHKQALLEAGAQRLGLSCVQALVQDARAHRQEWEKAFDLVLADVPCSGLGVIRKKPEIRYKDPEQMLGLPALQAEILQTVSAYVKPGGVLLYATCTLRREENEDLVQDFLDKHADFSAEPFSLPKIGMVERGMVTLWPQRVDTDGFFVAKLRRCP